MAANEINIRRRLRRYFQAYYFLGQSPFLNPSVSTKKISFIRDILLHLPAVLWSMLSALILVYGAIVATKQNLDKDIYVLISVSIMAVQSSVIIIASIQSFMKKSVLLLAIDQIQFLLNYFRSKLHLEISLDGFVRETQIDSLLIFVLYCVNVCIFTIFSFHKKWVHFASFLIFCLQIPTILITAHVILYINLLKYLMSQLNVFTKRSNTCALCQQLTSTGAYVMPWTGQCRRRLCDEMRIISIKRKKLVYYRLWRVSQLINDYFGWSLGAILIQNFVYSTNALYWCFIGIVININLKTISTSIIGPLIGLTFSSFLTLTLFNRIQDLYHQVTEICCIKQS